MNHYDSLVGQTFTRNGVDYTIVRLSGAMVVASMRSKGSTERVFVPLAQVLDSLATTEITLTELPHVRQDRPAIRP